MQKTKQFRKRVLIYLKNKLGCWCKRNACYIDEYESYGGWVSITLKVNTQGYLNLDVGDNEPCAFCNSASASVGLIKESTFEDFYRFLGGGVLEVLEKYLKMTLKGE